MPIIGHQLEGRRVLVAIIVCAAAVASACGKNPVSSSSTGGGSTTGSSSGSPRANAADLAFCVDETNRYRTIRNRPALARSMALEAYAVEGARSDGLANERRPFYAPRLRGAEFLTSAVLPRFQIDFLERNSSPATG